MPTNFPAPETPEHLEILRRIDGKMDKVLQAQAAAGRRAVVSGAVAGSVSGGLVATAVLYIKAKFGIGM